MYEILGSHVFLLSCDAVCTDTYRYPTATLHGVETQKNNIVMFKMDFVKWKNLWHVLFDILART